MESDTPSLRDGATNERTIQEPSTLRRLAAARFDAHLARRVRVLDDDALARTSLVVAPHPDDETIGCGGTIARMRALGARVIVVVCTDGSRSHHHLMESGALRARRAEELRAACARLGVDPADVHMLDCEDSTLSSHVDDAAKTIAAIARSSSIERMFVPFRGDAIADHAAARAAGLAARAASGRDIEILEYPVWFWKIWPFVPSEAWGIRGRLKFVRQVLAAQRLGRSLDVAVELGPALAIKRAALACHASQVTRLVDDPRWQRLSDIAGGEWLARCLREREYFARS